MATGQFSRLSPEQRRGDLIQATFECIAEYGLDGTNVRRVAEMAGVTNGLIRHYFPSKEALIEETYRTITGSMTELARDAAGQAGSDPKARLRAFVVASLSAPFASEQYLSFWSTFVGRILVNERMQAVHREGFFEYRAELGEMIEQVCASEGRNLTEERKRSLVVRVNALIDGLWIETCLAADKFSDAELVENGLQSVQDLIGVDLGL